MLALESDKTYRLNPVSAGGDDGKLYIHVKFTDSSFKAIEEYAARIFNAKKALGQNTNLTIDFAGDQGHFDVPTSDSSSGGSNNIRRFQFGLAPISLEGGSSSFECFQQKKMSESLAAFGAFARRLQVKAQEDVFDATREKMAAVVEESEKNRAREISTTNSLKAGGGAGRRATSLGHPASRPSAASAAASQATQAASLFDAASLAKRKAAERLSSMQSTMPGGSTSASVTGSSSSTHKPPTSQQQPREQQHSLRDRILYSLAVKQQTEAQLINALKLSSREAIELATIVKQLCYPLSHNNPNGPYQLRREAFGEVKFDHPLVSGHEDKMAIRRNANSATAASSSTMPIVQQQQKLQRPPPTSSGELGQGAPPKIRKLDEQAAAPSHPAQKLAPASAPIQSSSSLSSFATHVKTRPTAVSSSSAQSRVVNGHVVNNAKTTAPVSNNNSSSFNSSPNKDSNSGLMDVDFGSTSVDRRTEAKTSLGAGSTSSSPEIPVIENREQRSAMKADFMAKYAEYRRLHDTLSEKTAFFRDMRPQLEACEADSEQYRALEESIRDAYAKLQEDESYVAAKQKLDDLHLTLVRIKQAIEDYDLANASGSVPSSGTSSGGSQPQSSSSTSSSPAVTSTSVL